MCASRCGPHGIGHCCPGCSRITPEGLSAGLVSSAHRMIGTARTLRGRRPIKITGPVAAGSNSPYHAGPADVVVSPPQVVQRDVRPCAYVVGVAPQRWSATTRPGRTWSTGHAWAHRLREPPARPLRSATPPDGPHGVDASAPLPRWSTVRPVLPAVHSLRSTVRPVRSSVRPDRSTGRPDPPTGRPDPSTVRLPSHSTTTRHRQRLPRRR